VFSTENILVTGCAYHTCQLVARHCKRGGQLAEGPFHAAQQRSDIGNKQKSYQNSEVSPSCISNTEPVRKFMQTTEVKDPAVDGS